jgi:hypothetical protein
MAARATVVITTNPRHRGRRIDYHTGQPQLLHITRSMSAIAIEFSTASTYFGDKSVVDGLR